MTWLRFLLLVLLAACLFVGLRARQRDYPVRAAQPPPRRTPEPAVDIAQAAPVPAPPALSLDGYGARGYVLALTWTPWLCANQPGFATEPDCSTHGASLVVHGLWPLQQNRNDGCPTEHALGQAGWQAGRRVPLPDRLIRHEWTKHGTCTGWSAVDYFERMRGLRENLRVPANMATGRELRGTLRQFTDAWKLHNRGLDGDAMRVVCKNGSELYEVRFCLDDKLKPSRCPRGDQQDTCRDEVHMSGWPLP
jgi:ribonuclease T2